ncbi:MAG: DHH family phosphoesterase [Thermoanaerobacteraceae bacterium]|nr:DHH family phosphoesterase [Thermoanaerobacteraceae bacterium]
MNKKNFKLISSANIINLILSFILTVLMFHYNIYIAFISLILFIYVLMNEYFGWRKKRSELDRYIERLFFNVDRVSKNAIAFMPIAAAVINKESKIIWYNNKFNETFKDKKEINDAIEKYVKNYKFEGKLHIKIADRYYYIIGTEAQKKHKSRENDKFYNIFLIDETDYVEISSKLNESRPVLAYILVDNYEEALQATEDLKRPVVAAEIERRLSIWASSMNAFIKKYAADRYVMFMKNRELLNLEENRFEILDFIRDINAGNKIPVTLSIGVGADADEYILLHDYASSAIDLSLGRGGDQAVVKRGEKISIYGGKTQAVEKRTRVKARVVSHAIRKLIEESSNVFIMGHNFMDFDSLGAAIGMYRGAVALDKSAKIILDKSNPAVESMLQKIENEEDYDNPFINISDAKNSIDKNSLLIVVDTHRPEYLTNPEILDLIERIIVIDHHRRGREFIDKALLVYLEPYASSASELVTEILQYIKDRIDIKPIEAEALLAGIAVDTKNFTFRTGVRTFEAASYLRRKGADTTSIKILFQDDFKSYIMKSTIVKNAEITNDGIAIAISPEDANNVVISQAADELLNIKGVQASFVLLKRENDVIISGRSLGDINVQVILEKLDGGGHLTVAGAQVKKPLDEVLMDLKKAINEYLKEGEE